MTIKKQNKTEQSCGCCLVHLRARALVDMYHEEGRTVYRPCASHLSCRTSHVCAVQYRLGNTGMTSCAPAWRTPSKSSREGPSAMLSSVATRRMKTWTPNVTMSAHISWTNWAWSQLRADPLRIDISTTNIIHDKKGNLACSPLNQCCQSE